MSSGFINDGIGIKGETLKKIISRKKTSFRSQQEEEQSLMGLMSTEGIEKKIIRILHKYVCSVQVGWRMRAQASFAMYTLVHTHVLVSRAAPIATVLEVMYSEVVSIHCTVYLYMYDCSSREMTTIH